MLVCRWLRVRLAELTDTEEAQALKNPGRRMLAGADDPPVARMSIMDEITGGTGAHGSETAQRAPTWPRNLSAAEREFNMLLADWLPEAWNEVSALGGSKANVKRQVRINLVHCYSASSVFLKSSPICQRWHFCCPQVDYVPFAQLLRVGVLQQSSFPSHGRGHPAAQRRPATRTRPPHGSCRSSLLWLASF